jgi:hypothetical protein
MFFLECLLFFHTKSPPWQRNMPKKHRCTSSEEVFSPRVHPKKVDCEANWSTQLLLGAEKL